MLNQKRLTFLFIIVCLQFSCEKVFSPQYEQENAITKENMIELGKQLTNPYSVENMQIALDTIISSTYLANDDQASSFRTTTEQIDIEATDLYVRFLPKDSVELEFLKDDTTLVFYDYPLDFEIDEPGDYYQDPSLSQDQITWQYSVVKPEYAFPNVEYEILSELFIPENSEHYYEEDENTGDNNRVSQHFVLDKLETVSLYLTGNLPEDEKQKIDSQSSQDRRVCILFICWDEPDPWYPSGQITIDDSELGRRAVEGVLVKARRWFTTKSGRTNAGGHFRIGSFRRDVNYSLDWETYQFSIREEAWWFFSKQAGINGPKKREPWKVHLTQHSKSWFHATIFQAAYHYYYYDIKGLKRPPQNSFWKPQMKIKAFFKNNDDKNGSYAKDLRLFGIFAPIRLYNPQNSSSQIYATTIHELAHASHWELRKNNWNFDQTSDKVKESWARGVEWELTRMKYPIPYRGRTWNTDNRDYTLVVIDMMDGREIAATRTNWGFIDSNDEVSGYTIKQIENTLHNSSSWNQWRDNIKSKYSNSTEGNLDKLFKAYE